MREDVLSPHPQELPSLELLEEGELLDVVEGISFDQPISQSYELNRCLSKVESDTLGGECVVTLLVSVMILGDLKIVGIPIRAWVQVDKH